MTCCKRPSVQTMDHYKASPDNWDNPSRMVNRMCLTCGQHWYGVQGAAHPYTSKEWDLWLAQTFDERAA